MPRPHAQISQQPEEGPALTAYSGGQAVGPRSRWSSESADTPRLADQSIKVLYIVGWMRSGSTLLGSMLGGQPGHFYGGEMTYAWVDQQGRVCGCGELVLDCPHWGPVLERLKSNLPPSAPTVDEVDGLRQRLLRLRRLPHLAALCQGNARTARKDYDSCADAFASLYQEVQRESGARVIVDSSKNATLALLLGLAPSLEVFYVHLVRDPRNVAISESNHRSWEGLPATEYPPARSAFKSASNWAASNAVADLWLRRQLRPRWLLVRYEDLIASPKAIMDRIGQLTGEPIESGITRAGSRIMLASNHAIAGNPSRFSAGETTLYAQPPARRDLSRRSLQITNAITAGLRGRYSYL